MVAAGIALGLVVVMLLAVLVQPRSSWRAAAEHSKRFWVGWALVCVAVGVVPAAALGELPIGGGLLVWMLFCCALAALQPSMLADLREVRTHRGRRRARAHGTGLEPRLRPADPSPVEASRASRGGGEPEPIRWLAPEGAAIVSRRQTRIGTFA